MRDPQCIFENNEIEDPHLTLDRIEREDPKFIKSKMLHDDPITNFEKLESAEPSKRLERKESWDPSVAVSKSEQIDPKRENPLNDSVLPMNTSLMTVKSFPNCTFENILTLEPKRVKDRTLTQLPLKPSALIDKDDAKRANPRKDIVLPMFIKSKTEQDDPRKTRPPNTDNVEPILITDLRERDEPSTASSTIESEDPNLVVLRTDNVEPR
jgi:hypothetical protein